MIQKRVSKTRIFHFDACKLVRTSRDGISKILSQYFTAAIVIKAIKIKNKTNQQTSSAFNQHILSPILTMATSTSVSTTGDSSSNDDPNHPENDDGSSPRRNSHSSSVNPRNLPLDFESYPFCQFIDSKETIEPATTATKNYKRRKTFALRPFQKTRKRPSSMLDSIPKDVLSKDILGFLTDKTVKVFLDSLPDDETDDSYRDLRKQFCPRHGARLEDPRGFVTSSVGVSEATTSISTGSCSSCPTCHAQAQNTKRCNGCKVFYPRYRKTNESGNASFPGLWCQSCDHMAFCNACMSNEIDGCGSEVSSQSNNMHNSHTASTFGRKMGSRQQRKRRYCGSDRISCHNYCCPNVFTNTMCGEFICDDCGDERQRVLRQEQQCNTISENYEHTVEVCDECGKATCLDPNCLVCADFKLIHMSCKFSPEDAYSLNGILWGRTTNGSNDKVNTKLKRNLSDGLVWILVLMALSKMWWFQKQQQQQLGDVASTEDGISLMLLSPPEL